MQGQTQKQNSFFDSIFNFIAPQKVVQEISATKQKKIVFDIFFENRTDFVKAELECYDMDDESVIETLFIKHADLHKWLDDTDRLTVTEGSNHMEGGDIVEDEHTATIGYVDYIENYMRPADIKDFILFKKLPYEFDNHI